MCYAHSNGTYPDHMVLGAWNWVAAAVWGLNPAPTPLPPPPVNFVGLYEWRDRIPCPPGVGVRGVIKDPQWVPRPPAVVRQPETPQPTVMSATEEARLRRVLITPVCSIFFSDCMRIRFADKLREEERARFASELVWSVLPD